MSMRGKSASPLCTRVPGLSWPKACTLSQVLRLSSSTPSWANMRAGVEGMVGPTYTATARQHSAR